MNASQNASSNPDQNTGIELGNEVDIAESNAEETTRTESQGRSGSPNAEDNGADLDTNKSTEKDTGKEEIGSRNGKKNVSQQLTATEVLQTFVTLLTPNDTNKKRGIKRALDSVPEERYNAEHKDDIQELEEENEDVDDNGEAFLVHCDDDNVDPDDCVLLFD